MSVLYWVIKAPKSGGSVYRIAPVGDFKQGEACPPFFSKEPGWQEQGVDCSRVRCFVLHLPFVDN